MKRLRHWLFNFAAAVAAVIAIASGLFWLRSYSVADLLTIERRGTNALILHSASGVFDLTVIRRYAEIPDEPFLKLTIGHLSEVAVWDPTVIYRTSANQASWKFGPFGFARVSHGYLGWMRRLEVAAWIPLLASLSVVVGRLAASLRRTQIVPGQCQGCGYDLRATPDRCPECGAIPSAARGAAA